MEKLSVQFAEKVLIWQENPPGLADRDVDEAAMSIYGRKFDPKRVMQLGQKRSGGGVSRVLLPLNLVISGPDALMVLLTSGGRFG